MDKEKEIEEMANVIAEICEKQSKKYKCDDCNNCMAEFLLNIGYRKADEVRKETAKEILEDLLGIIDEGYHRQQVNTTISSPFMNGENCAYKVVIVRMKQALKGKYGVEVDE